MNLILLVYLAGSVDSIRIALVMGGLMGIGIYGMFCIVSFVEYGISRSKWPLGAFVAMLLLAAFIPSQKTAYAMIAAGGLQHLSQSERVQGIADNSLKIIERTLGEYLQRTNESK